MHMCFRARPLGNTLLNICLFLVKLAGRRSGAPSACATCCTMHVVLWAVTIPCLLLLPAENIGKSFKNHWMLKWQMKSKQKQNWMRSKNKSRNCLFSFRAYSPSVKLFGNWLGHCWTSRGRARVANAHKVGLPKNETIVTSKQSSTKPNKLPRD